MPEYQLYCFAQSGNAYRVALMLNLTGKKGSAPPGLGQPRLQKAALPKMAPKTALPEKGEAVAAPEKEEPAAVIKSLNDYFKIVVDPGVSTHDKVMVAGKEEDTPSSTQVYPSTDLNNLTIPPDESVPYQELPDDADRPEWLVPIGWVRLVAAGLFFLFGLGALAGAAGLF